MDFPTQFDGKAIKDRIPYTMRGEMLVPVATSGVQFPETTFQHNVDKPFEIHRVIPDLTGFTDASPTVQVTPTLATNFQNFLDKGVRLNIIDTAKNELLTKNPTLIAQLINKMTRTWEWPKPYTLRCSTNFLVTVDNIIPAAFATGTLGGVASVNVAQIRVELSFQGYLLVTERIPA